MVEIGPNALHAISVIVIAVVVVIIAWLFMR
jgi:hypothetical protein